MVACEGREISNNCYLLLKDCVETKRRLATLDPCFAPLAADTEMDDP